MVADAWQGDAASSAPAATIDLHRDLELCSALFERGDWNAGIAHFLRTSNQHWYRRSEQSWAQFVAIARERGLLSRFHEDPLTARSFHKPRGYAGDAELLDLIYDHDGANQMALAAASTGGRELNHVTWNAPEPAAVRWRRDYMAGLIDALPEAGGRVLSIAAGSCRELSVSASASARTIGRFVALDQDLASLDDATASYPGLVEPLPIDAISLVRGDIAVDEFDLIYSAGLFDYLSDRAARRLISAAAEMAAPGGELCIANFAPTPFSIGYMESAMAWELIYRNEADLLQLITEAVVERPYTVSTRRDPLGVVVYAHVRFTRAS